MRRRELTIKDKMRLVLIRIRLKKMKKIIAGYEKEQDQSIPIPVEQALFRFLEYLEKELTD